MFREFGDRPSSAANEFGDSLPISPPQFRGNLEGEPSDALQPFTYSFRAPESVPGTRIEPPSPALSGAGSSGDNAGSANGIDAAQTPDESSDPADVEQPLTPTSFDGMSDDGFDVVDISDTSSDGSGALPPGEDASEGDQNPPSLLELVTEWLWGDIPPRRPVEGEDERDLEDGDVFVPFRPQEHGNPGNPVNPAAPAAPPDPEGADAADDADDLEAIMELIGMQGPIFALLQNAVFCALLISFAVAAGIWLPYLWGKIGLVLLTNPIRFLIGVPLTILTMIADIAADAFIGSFAAFVYFGGVALRILIRQLSILIPSLRVLSGNNAVTSASISLMEGSGQRLRRVMVTLLTFHESDLPMFSVLSRQALKVHEARIAALIRSVLLAGRAVLYDFPLLLLTSSEHPTLFRDFLGSAPGKLQHAVLSTLKVTGDFISFAFGSINLSYYRTVNSESGPFPLDPELARWDSKDRAIAILVGYSFATLLGLLYLRTVALAGAVGPHQRAHGAVADALQQAGGVMKVIFIIGIEMIVFPLYCGILLDIALLPLFETATAMSRLYFTLSSPLTSLFVHWFVGTCYMFHFALFVSMCRKILRSGVLCMSLPVALPPDALFLTVLTRS
jgi:E3 ubiquitin-protein ligase MARCH6